MTIPATIPQDVLSDPQALYDFFMSYIEPDLVSANIPTLDVPYDGETSQQKTERYECYSSAFQLFDEVVEEFNSDMAIRTQDIAYAMDMAAQEEDTQSQTDTLTKLDSQINDQ